MAGRPTKLDDLVCKRIVDAIAEGCTRAGAAKAAGVSRTSVQEWLARGRDGEPEYADFADKVRAAEGKIENRVVSALLQAVEGGHVGAMMFWLERRRHEDWGKRDQVTHVGDARGVKQEGDDLEIARSVVAALESKKSA